jgi:hypothetical protein
MVDQAVLRQLREQRFFLGWDEFVRPDRAEASEDSLRRLVDDLLALPPEPTEGAVRLAVDECVRRFNALDDGCGSAPSSGRTSTSGSAGRWTPAVSTAMRAGWADVIGEVGQAGPPLA